MTIVSQPSIDISHHFLYNAQDEIIIRRILKYAKTPKAIVEFSIHRHKLSDYAYWFVLSTLWVDYTGWSSLKLWRNLFESTRPHREECLMKPSELLLFRSLPDPVIAYRAHRPGETDWLSYTMSEAVAERFARERRIKSATKYSVPRQSIIALFARREEWEILVLDRTGIVCLEETENSLAK